MIKIDKNKNVEKMNARAENFELKKISNYQGSNV